MRVKQALSTALSADAIHVARRTIGVGGERYFYRPGPKPLRLDTFDEVHETLRAMYAAANGRGFTVDGKERT